MGSFHDQRRVIEGGEERRGFRFSVLFKVLWYGRKRPQKVVHGENNIRSVNKISGRYPPVAGDPVPSTLPSVLTVPRVCL